MRAPPIEQLYSHARAEYQAQYKTSILPLQSAYSTAIQAAELHAKNLKKNAIRDAINTGLEAYKDSWSFIPVFRTPTSPDETVYSIEAILNLSGTTPAHINHAILFLDDHPEICKQHHNPDRAAAEVIFKYFINLSQIDDQDTLRLIEQVNVTVRAYTPKSSMHDLIDTHIERTLNSLSSTDTTDITMREYQDTKTQIASIQNRTNADIRAMFLQYSETWLIHNRHKFSKSPTMMAYESAQAAALVNAEKAALSTCRPDGLNPYRGLTDEECAAKAQELNDQPPEALGDSGLVGYKEIVTPEQVMIWRDIANGTVVLQQTAHQRQACHDAYLALRPKERFVIDMQHKRSRKIDIFPDILEHSDANTLDHLKADVTAIVTRNITALHINLLARLREVEPEARTGSTAQTAFLGHTPEENKPTHTFSK